MLLFQQQPESLLVFMINASQILLAIICMFAALGIVLLVHKATHVEGSDLIGRLEVVAFGIVIAPFVINTVVRLSRHISDPPGLETAVVTLNEFFTIFAALITSLLIYLGAKYLQKKLYSSPKKYR